MLTRCCRRTAHPVARPPSLSWSCSSCRNEPAMAEKQPVGNLSPMDTGNTAWVLASAALVLFMTPGLAFFYGGMVRSKNVLDMLMENFISIAIVSVLWAAVGFSLAFGDRGGWIGNFSCAGLK